MQVKTEEFGFLPSGDSIKKFTLTNKNGVQVVLTNYGATMMCLLCPDRDGVVDDILLGFDDLQGYTENRFFGATIGRFANRIAEGRFTLNGKTYNLDCNNGNNHLHGGYEGFDKKVWGWTELDGGIKFSLDSPDGDQGYPGQLEVTSTYQINDEDELTMKFVARVDSNPTIINMTNHAFINLAGQTKENKILDHIMEINAKHYLPVNNMIPTVAVGSIQGKSRLTVVEGESRNSTAVEDGILVSNKNSVKKSDIKEVNETFSFYQNSRKAIGKDLALVEGGYDHCYCLEKSDNGFCARVHHEGSGRTLEIFTDQPGVQFYTGNFLDVIGKNNNRYTARSGFCLEPQNYPNSINQVNFPSSLLKPDEKYERYIKWKLSLC